MANSEKETEDFRDHFNIPRSITLYSRTPTATTNRKQLYRMLAENLKEYDWCDAWLNNALIQADQVIPYFFDSPVYVREVINQTIVWSRTKEGSIYWEEIMLRGQSVPVKNSFKWSDIVTPTVKKKIKL